MVTIQGDAVAWKSDDWEIVYDSNKAALVLNYLNDSTVSYEFGEDDSISVGTLTADTLDLGGDIQTANVTADTVDVADQLGVPVYSDDSFPSAENVYYHSGQNRIKYKDSNGNVHEPSDYLIEDTASVITTASESSLSNSSVHANLSGGDLHDPATHDDAQHSYRDRFSFSQSHTLWEDGLNDEEIFRYQCESGELFRLKEIQFRQKGGGSSADADLDVYNATQGTEMASASLGSTVHPDMDTNTGDLILIRVTNTTGAVIEASMTISGETR